MAKPLDVKFNPPDLIQRMARYPKKFEQEVQTSGKETLFHIQGSVPPYPEAVEGSRYKRTGTLGKSLGATEEGNMTGFNEWHEQNIQQIGVHVWEIKFGTRLQYAPKVIGSETQDPFFGKRGWYTVQTIADKAREGIDRIWEAFGDRLAEFLNGRG